MKIVAFLKKNIKNNINILLLCTILVFVVLIFRKKMREGNFVRDMQSELEKVREYERKIINAEIDQKRERERERGRELEEYLSSAERTVKSDLAGSGAGADAQKLLESDTYAREDGSPPQPSLCYGPAC